MMAAIPMQANAAELTNVNGVSIETADYSDSYFLEDGSAEGIAKGIEQRGSIIDTATVQISNLGKGDIGIIIEFEMHVECDKIKILQYCKDKRTVNGWRFQDIYMMPKKKIFQQKIYQE